MGQIFLGATNDTNYEEDVKVEKSQFPEFNFRRERTYQIIATDLNDEEGEILANPNILDLAESDLYGLPVKSRRARMVTRLARHPETGVPTALWEVTISADSELKLSGGGGTETDPTNLDPVIDWEIEEEDVAFAYDVITGLPVQNVNGEWLFEERQASYPVAVLTRYETYPVDPLLVQTFHNSINLSSFWGFAPGSCRMKIQSEHEDIEMPGKVVQRFAKVTYRIAVKVGDFYESRPWVARFLNEGYYVRQYTDFDFSVSEPFLNKPTGEKTKVNLRLDGTILNNDEDPVYLEFNRYRYQEWYDLGLHLPDDYPDGPP
jgi:hypothetical protein